MRRTLGITLALTAVGLVYCGDATGPGFLGPVEVGIVSGDGQITTAGTDSLFEPLVLRAVKGENGAVSFVLGPKPLVAAQTSVATGVPGVFTQSRPWPNDGLVAWIDYATTDSAGYADYWYQAGTVATDSSCADIRATIDGTPTLVATTCAQVLAGPPAVHNFRGGNGVTSGTEEQYPYDAVADAYGNEVPWMFAEDCGGCVTIAGDLADWKQVIRSVAPLADGSGNLYVIVEGGDTLATAPLSVYTTPDGYLRMTYEFP